jgi:hypothetical protein
MHSKSRRELLKGLEKGYNMAHLIDLNSPIAFKRTVIKN